MAGRVPCLSGRPIGFMNGPAMKSILFLSATLCGAWSVAAQPVKLISVEMRSAVPKAAEEIAFGQFPDNGTKVEVGFLIPAAEGKSLVDIKEKACKITETTDAASGQPVKLKVEFGSFPRVSKDGTLAYHSLEFEAPAEPAAGRLKLSGTLALVTATGVKTEKQENLVLVDAAKVQAGALKLTIDDLKTGGGKTSFDLKSSKPMSAIKTIRFYKPDGTEVKGDRNGSSTMSGFGTYSESWSFHLEEEVKELSFEFDIHQNITETEVPFDFNVPAGL